MKSLRTTFLWTLLLRTYTWSTSAWTSGERAFGWSSQQFSSIRKSSLPSNSGKCSGKAVQSVEHKFHVEHALVMSLAFFGCALEVISSWHQTSLWKWVTRILLVVIFGCKMNEVMLGFFWSSTHLRWLNVSTKMLSDFCLILRGSRFLVLCPSAIHLCLCCSVKNFNYFGFQSTITTIWFLLYFVCHTSCGPDECDLKVTQFSVCTITQNSVSSSIQSVYFCNLSLFRNICNICFAYWVSSEWEWMFVFLCGLEGKIWLTWLK